MYEGCPESMSLIYFLSKYLFPSHENYTLWRVIVWLHILFFHTDSAFFYGLTTTNKCVYAVLVLFLVLLLQLVLTEQITLLSVSDFVLWIASFWLQIGGNLRVLDWGYKHCKLFMDVPNSLSATRNSITAHCLWRTSLTNSIVRHYCSDAMYQKPLQLCT